MLFRSVFAFLMVPIFEGHANSLTGIAEILSKGYAAAKDSKLLVNSQEYATNYAIYMQSITCAFCVLSLSELFHMLGMTSLRKSFVHNFWSKNWLLWVSFIVGVGLQVAVVNIPGINEFFSCYPLDIGHWGIIIALSAAPLVVHEIVALVLFIKRKVQR